MHEDFVPAVEPSQDPPGSALYFAFKKDQILIRLADRRAHIPTLEDFGQFGLIPQGQHYLGTSAQHGHCFALDLPEDCAAPTGMAFHSLRSLIGKMEEDLFWIGGRAVQIVAWARDHRFCGRCATATRPHPKDRAQVCPACGLISFPRLSPAIIVAVERDGHLLLAHNHRFPAGRYSVLAGFVEAGETFEQTVAREVWEEVSIQVRDVRYFGSQPWPFPNSLMVGFTARYAGGEIKVDPDELADADWFAPDQMPDLPDGISISRRLIDDFLTRHGAL